MEIEQWRKLSPNERWTRWQNKFRQQVIDHPPVSPHEDYYSQAILISNSPTHAAQQIRYYQKKYSPSSHYDMSKQFIELYERTKYDI